MESFVLRANFEHRIGNQIDTQRQTMLIDGEAGMMPGEMTTLLAAAQHEIGSRSLLGIIGMIIALPLTSLLSSYYRRYISEPAPRSDDKTAPD